MSVSGRISTYCRRKLGHPGAAKCSPSHVHESRMGPSRTNLRSTGPGAGGGKRRRTALTRRARSRNAHCHGPYSSGGWSEAPKTAGASLAGAHEGVTHLDALHGLSQGKPQVPHPLTGDLPQFLPTLGGGTPAIGIFFDVADPTSPLVLLVTLAVGA
jgi:hypothetical protein